MTDVTTPEDGLEPESDQGLTPNSPSQGNEVTPEEEPRTAELARENAKWRRQVRDLEAKVKAFEDSQLSEQERTAKDRDDLAARLASAESDLRNTRIQQAIISEAAKQQVVDPEAASMFLRDRLELDDSGHPMGVSEAVAELLKERPYLASSGRTPVPTAPTANPSQNKEPADGRVFTSEQLEDRDFWNANKDEIMRALAEGRIQD